MSTRILALRPLEATGCMHTHEIFFARSKVLLVEYFAVCSAGTLEGLEPSRMDGVSQGEQKTSKRC